LEFFTKGFAEIQVQARQPIVSIKPSQDAELEHYVREVAILMRGYIWELPPCERSNATVS